MLLDVSVIRPGDKMDGHLIFQRLTLDDHLDEFHHVLDLIKIANVRVCHYDPRCTVQIGPKQFIVADAFSVFGEYVVTLFGARLGGRRGLRCVARLMFDFDDVIIDSICGLVLLLWV